MSRGVFPIATTAIALSLSIFNAAVAQSNSSPPIRLIVPAAPGGAIEPYARLISEHMAKTLGQVIIVENKPGANGNIAAQFVVEAPADGNLILVGTQSMTEINPSASDDLKWSLNDFIPLIRGVVAPLVLVTHPSVPAKTLAELVAWIKSNPGKLSYSSYTAGTPSHFLGFQMNERFGLDLAHVPYRGSGPQTTDLVAGHSLLGFSQMQSTLPILVPAGSTPLRRPVVYGLVSCQTFQRSRS
jgi:tripartite-type tricarboxylate transporter receptor subunit TctC